MYLQVGKAPASVRLSIVTKFPSASKNRWFNEINLKSFRSSLVSKRIKMIFWTLMHVRFWQLWASMAMLVPELSCSHTRQPRQHSGPVSILLLWCPWISLALCVHTCLEFYVPWDFLLLMTSIYQHLKWLPWLLELLYLFRQLKCLGVDSVMPTLG